MFTILAGFLPAKTLADGYPLIPQDVPFGDGCASCGLWKFEKVKEKLYVNGLAICIEFFVSRSLGMDQYFCNTSLCFPAIIADLFIFKNWSLFQPLIDKISEYGASASIGE